MIRSFLAAAQVTLEAPPKALIVPHAGYIYSGPVAASAYVNLKQWAEAIARVVMVGPSHQVWFEGLALPDADLFRTPLGDVPVEEPSFLHAPVGLSAAAHAREHSLEVQVPFLQELLTEWSLVPLVAGDVRPEEVHEALEETAGGPETLFVISSDLSHYLPYDVARRVDEQTARAIVERRPELLGRDSACGRLGIQGVLLYARAHDLHVRLLDLRNSGDTQGDRSRVVGYGAFAIGP